jgi:hypothetical protein
MNRAAGIGERAHDLASSVNPDSASVRGAGDIDRDERAVVQQKTMAGPPGIYVTAHDLAPSVDPVG